jgi:hypothetical protein
MKLNDKVREFWESEACGTGDFIVGKLKPLSKQWFERIEFKKFDFTEIIPIITNADSKHWPQWGSKFFPDSWGWYIGIRARK